MGCITLKMTVTVRGPTVYATSKKISDSRCGVVLAKLPRSGTPGASHGPAMRAAAQRTIWMTGWMTGWMILLVCMAVGCKQKTRLPPPLTSDSKTASNTIEMRPTLPAPRPGGFVGSQACIECHREISELYRQHPMGNSVASMTDAENLESIEEGWLDIPGPQKYRVTRTDGQLIHAQCLYDDSGTLVHEQAETVDFCVGSGQSGRAYLIQQGDALYQSPIGWYSGSDSWDLSPGYSAGGHQGFTRRIDNSCLYCHTGGVNSKNEARYLEPVFSEAAIGCERCHGPGKAHIDFHHSGAFSNIDRDQMASDPIVNPVDLATPQREDVCNQCHLQSDYVIKRFGRDFFDFRPGDRLEDVFVILSENSRGRTRAVSHVEQMRESVCYLKSEGELGCISCHDPHRKPSREQMPSFYRDACLKCHEPNSCLISHEERHAEPFNNSCYNCHMPEVDTSNVAHTAQTDHRIVRSPGEVRNKRQSGNDQLTAFDNAATRLPEWELDRAKGIALMSTAWNRADRGLALKARRFLIGSNASDTSHLATINALGQDVPALAEVGSSYWLAGPQPVAKFYWQRVLEWEPENETALGGLATLESQQENWPAALGHLDKLIDVAPFDTQWLVQKAKVLHQIGRTDDARLVAEKALKINPTLTELKDWLKRLGPDA